MKLGPLAVVALLAATASANPDGGFTAAVGGGTNVGTPFIEAQLGRRFHRAPFLEIGTAVISYRLVPDVTFDEEFSDVATAITWTHDHIGSYGGDAANMVVVGHSAGGHMTALAGVDDARLTAAGMDVTAIKGYVPLSPILDVQQLAMDPPSDNATIIEQVFHGDIARNSPVTYFRAGVAPMLVVLGGDDLSALRKQVPPAVAALAALGAPVTLVELPGKNHEDIVIDFDTDGDAVTPVLAPFIHDHTH